MAGFVNDYLRNSLEKRELHKITSPPIWLKRYLYYLNIIIGSGGLAEKVFPEEGKRGEGLVTEIFKASYFDQVPQ